jgi:hypothetical protein
MSFGSQRIIEGIDGNYFCWGARFRQIVYDEDDEFFQHGVSILRYLVSVMASCNRLDVAGRLKLRC